MTPIVDLVRRYGMNAKLKHAIIADRGWRRSTLHDPGEWYERWPEIARELADAARVVEVEEPGRWSVKT